MVERVYMCVDLDVVVNVACGCISAHTVAVKHSDGADENKPRTDTIFYIIFFSFNLFNKNNNDYISIT